VTKKTYVRGVTIVDSAMLAEVAPRFFEPKDKPNLTRPHESK
jgi:hypothetical protein